MRILRTIVIIKFIKVIITAVIIKIEIKIKLYIIFQRIYF